TNGSTHTDLTGKTVTFTGADTYFKWNNDANVGGSVERLLNFSNTHGLGWNDAAFNKDIHTLLFVVKRIGTSGNAWFGTGDTAVSSTAGFSINFSSTGEIRVWEHFSHS